MVVNDVFPTPIVISNFDGDLASLQDTVIECSNDLTKNVGNHVSKNTYVLNLKEFSHIKSWIDEQVNKYYDEILGIDTTVVAPYVTQSWLTFTNPNDFHHQHRHSNSLVSGVFYINATEEFDSIVFHKDTFKQIDILPIKHSIYNSNVFVSKVKSGMLVMFPSDLLHEVDPSKGDYTRISLAFNTFVKGEIGYESGLTSLKLNV
jgi:uncharacterized protein (TIGR02466 family)